MSYTAQTWVDGAGGGTPLSAARLNHLEAGIVTAETDSDTYDKRTRVVVATDASGDYATLAAAVSAATAGTEIFLKAGTHALTSVTVPDDVAIRGSRVGVNLSGAFTGLTNVITLGSRSAIRGVTLQNTHATGGGVAVNIATESDVTAEDVTVTGPWAQGILTNNSTDVRVRGCHFNDIGITTGTTPGDGINIYASSGISVVGCTFTDCKQDGVYVGASSFNVTINGNTFRRCVEGVQVRVSCESVTISGNTFDIKAASGISSFGVIIQTDSVDCVVSGNTFRTTTGTGTPLAAVVVDNRSHRTVISNNTVKGSYPTGVQIQTTGGGGTESVDCVVTGNTCLSLSQYAIFVASAENGAVVSGNSIRYGGNKGILVSAYYCAVTGNKVRGPGGFDGISIQGSFNTVSGNEVLDVGANAGILLAGNNNAAAGNTCTNNNTYGINDSGDYNVIVGNNCSSNLHASADIASTGANSKVAYNIGRYTQQGAA